MDHTELAQLSCRVALPVLSAMRSATVTISSRIPGQPRSAVRRGVRRAEICLDRSALLPVTSISLSRRPPLRRRGSTSAGRLEVATTHRLGNALLPLPLPLLLLLLLLQLLLLLLLLLCVSNQSHRYCLMIA